MKYHRIIQDGVEENEMKPKKKIDGWERIIPPLPWEVDVK